MQTLKGLLDKKRRDKNSESKDGKRRLKHQFQDIALDLAQRFKVNPQQKKILFSFIKNKLEKGQWWKVKEVSEYMELKDIKSLNYFMAAFRKKENDKDK